VTPQGPPQRLNILLLTADDMNGDTPGSFGGPPEVTPAIDALAAQGVSYRRAHVPIAICQPSRSAMLTGRWPHRNGAEGFEPIHDDVPVLTDLLRPAGYRVGILGKVDHLAPVERFGWHTAVPQRELGLGRDPAAYARAAAAFVGAAARAGQPWFLMANAHDPHRPFHGSAAELAAFAPERLAEVPAPSRVFKPGDWPVPGFLPDLDAAQREVAEYLSSSRRCDDVVRAVLDVLDESGQADRTLVVFLSDNGMAFPFAKANCYLHGTRTPLVVRWPGRTAAGRVDDEHFVSGLDLFPTFCEAAGIPVPDDLDGTTLTGLLAGEREPGRDHVVTVFHENWGKDRFEMRCIQDGRHGYIWNSWSDGGTRYVAEHMGTDTWRAMDEASATDGVLAARRDFYLFRRPEELYDVGDTDSLEELSGRAESAPVLAEFRRRLGDWMAAVDDPLRDRFTESILRP
jgi:N-sulfoglucosamine sulfohydrolase